MPANVDASYIIQRPLLSEKSTWAMNEQQRYSFAVDRRATKDEIKAAIESLYKVSVTSVNTTIKKHKAKRYRTGIVVPMDTKKAIVTLKEGDKIELF
jgi:large subunit ribosomal protein L23